MDRRIFFALVLFGLPLTSRSQTLPQDGVFAESSVDIDGDGKKELVRIKLLEGKQGADPDNRYEYEAWIGTYTVSVIRNGKVIGSRVIGEYRFLEKFDLVFDDYNQDGNIDFSLERLFYNKPIPYDIYSIRKNGKVSKLGSVELGNYGSPSWKIDKYKNYLTGSMNGAGETWRVFYKWTGHDFSLLKWCPVHYYEGMKEDIEVTFKSPQCR